MVVVYSGDSDRPPPNWDVEQPSERATIAHFEPVVAVSPPVPVAEPFPLAQDLSPELAGLADPLADLDEPSRQQARASAGAQHRSQRTSSAPSARTARVSKPAPAPRSRSQLAGTLAAVAILGASVAGAAFTLLRPTGREAAPMEPSVQTSPAPPPPAQSARVAAVLQVPARPEPAKPVMAPTQAPAPALDNGKFKRVEIEVFPADAKVVRRGVRQPGPPFVFNIPKDKQISIEITKPGYVTRKVVLDGSESTVMVGLFRKGLRRRAEPDARAPAREFVQSGL